MPDVNPQGFGAPFAKVFNKFQEVQVKLKSFTYVHDEEKDDTCTIVIEDTDVTLPDKEEFQEGAKLYVIWGYLDGESSKKRTVYVKDIKVNYSRTGVILTLKCYDKASRMRQRTTQKVHKDVDMDQLAEGIASDHGLEYIPGTPSERRKISLTRLRFRQLRAEARAKSEELLQSRKDLHKSTGRPKLINNATPSVLNEDTNWETAIDETSHVALVDLTRYPELPQGNKTDRDILDEVVAREPGGPWVVEGRDDKLIIRKRNLNQKPIKTYEYGGGNFELLSFTPETKGKAKAASAINQEMAGINPEFKQVIQTNANTIANANGEDFLGDEVDGSLRGSKAIGRSRRGSVGNAAERQLASATRIKFNLLRAEARTKSEELLQSRVGAEGFDLRDLNNINPQLSEESGTNLEGEKFENVPFHIIDPTSPGILQESSSNWTSQIDNTAVPMMVGFSLEPLADPTIHVDTIDDVELMRGAGDNARANSALKKNPGTAVCLGDPNVVSGKVITVLNVSKKYSGNYYVVSADHQPKHPGGYLMTLKLSKNAVGSTGTKQPGKLDTNVLAKIRKKTRVLVNKEVGPTKTEKEGNFIPEVVAEEPKSFEGTNVEVFTD